MTQNFFLVIQIIKQADENSNLQQGVRAKSAPGN